MDPEIDPVVVDEKAQRIVHRVGGVGLFDRVERRAVSAVEGVDPEIAGGGSVLPVTRDDRK